MQLEQLVEMVETLQIVVVSHSFQFLVEVVVEVATLEVAVAVAELQEM
jgi:hypothetical protein